MSNEHVINAATAKKYGHEHSTAVKIPGIRLPAAVDVAALRNTYTIARSSSGNAHSHASTLPIACSASIASFVVYAVAETFPY